jgi:2-C-methyl-D-erythritol 2,4-cyclodiphosphate synthase
VTVPHHLGLAGHSDADVVAHALMDALLGAAGLEDIGALFPDTDMAFAGADSMALLRTVFDRLTTAGWRVSNVDIVVIAEAPKLARYREAMRTNLATALKIPSTAVGIKATTTERMGFTGRGEGIAAQAVCLIEGA